MLRAGSSRCVRIVVAASLAVCAGGEVAAQAQNKPFRYPQTSTLTLPTGDQKALAPSKAARPLPSHRLGVKLISAVVPQVSLEPVDRDALLAEDEQNRRTGKTKTLRYGLGRPVSLRPVDGSWHEVQGGALWVAEVVSPEALGLRLRFADVSLPAGAELAVYGVENDGPALLRSPFNLSSVGEPRVEYHDADAQARRTFWTATLPGERARIELFVPAASALSQGAARELPFTVDRLQHIYLDPVAGASGGTKAAGPCHNDVSCFPAWATVARAVAGVGVIGNDAAYCSGQLLNSLRADFTPYFLTANHCLSRASEAADTEIYWFYQTPSCGAAPPRIADVPSSVGASLLATDGTPDFTLLMVEGTLPAEVAWAGWTSAPVRTGEGAVAIHHPDGDYKRISFGNKGNDAACSGGSRGDNVQINWTDAPTEPGSSGSGIFRSDTRQLFGQLSFGPSACGTESYDCYGAFSSAFTRIRGLMREGSDDDLEQNDSCASARPMGVVTTQGIVKFADHDWYRISVPAGQTLRVELSFTHSRGDVDARLFSACGGEPVATAEGVANTEVLTVTNSGGSAAEYIWQVYLGADTRNGYTMIVTLQ